MIITKHDLIARLIDLIGISAQLDSEIDLKSQAKAVDNLEQELHNLTMDLVDVTHIPESPDESVLREVAARVALKERDYSVHLERIAFIVDQIFRLIAIRAPQVIMEAQLNVLRRAITIVEEKYQEEKW